MRAVHAAACALAAALLPAAGRAAEGGSELALFDLDEQLKAETSVASVKARSIRETPAIVTVVGRDEFLATGARNIFDVLAMVPGFQIGGEIGNTTGLGFRGMWGSDGKVLVLVDGLPANDLLTGNLEADGIPLEQVQSIEIVRGPGSALYGGFAELAVVQITTRGAAELERGAAAVSVGQMPNGLGSRTVSAGWGRRFDAGWFTAQATLGHAERSDRLYVDGLGQSASFAGNSRTDPVSLAVGGGWRGLQLRFRYADWKNETVDGYGDVLPAPVQQRFRSLTGEAHWDLPLGEGLVLTPRLLAQSTTPWQQTEASSYGIYDRTGERLTGRLALAWHASPALEVMTGAEAFVERSHPNAGQPVSGPDDPYGTTARYATAAAFGEVSWDTSVVNLLAGMRYEHHELYGSSFVPRIVATRLFAPFHAKLLYSRAYRAPALDNLASNPALVPEHASFYEAELGWQPSEHFFAVVNAYDANVEDAIVYTHDASQAGAGQDMFLNSGRTGSRGIEVDARFHAGAFSASAGYAFYTAQGVNRVAEFEVAGHPQLMLGFAGHKVTARATARLPRSLDLTATAVWLSERYGDEALGADGQAVLGRVPPRLDLGLFAWWRDVGARGLDLGAGVHDLLDSGAVYVLPYHSVNGVHPPLPAASREIFLRVAWEPR